MIGRSVVAPPQPTPTFPDPPPSNMLKSKEQIPNSPTSQLLQSQTRPLSEQATIIKQTHTPTEPSPKQPSPTKHSAAGSVKPVMGSSQSATGKAQREVLEVKAEKHSVMAPKQDPPQQDLSLEVAFNKPPIAPASSVPPKGLEEQEAPQQNQAGQYASEKPPSQKPSALVPSREPSVMNSVGPATQRTPVEPPSRSPTYSPEKSASKKSSVRFQAEPSVRSQAEPLAGTEKAPTILAGNDQEESPLNQTHVPVAEPPNKRIEFKCQKGDLHEDESLNIVCTQPSCGGELCCNVCVEQFHQSHRVKPLKWLISTTEKLLASTKQTNEDEPLEEVNGTELAKDRVLEASNSLIETLTEHLFTTEKLTKKLEYKLTCYGPPPPPHPEEPHQEKTHPQTEQELREYAYQVLCKYQVLSQTVPNKEVDVLQKEITSVLMGFEKHIKDYELQRRLKDILIKENFGNYFGELRHQEMLIVSPSTVRFVGDQRDFKIAIIEPFIKPGQHTYRFRLQGADWACYGLCRLTTVRDFDYVWKYDRTGHGVYGMSASGKTYSHIHANDNYTDKGFKFDSSETVVMRIDTHLRKIKFSTDLSVHQKKTTVSYEQEDPLEPLYVCVILSKVGSLVEYRTLP